MRHLNVISYSLTKRQTDIYKDKSLRTIKDPETWTQTMQMISLRFLYSDNSIKNIYLNLTVKLKFISVLISKDIQIMETNINYLTCHNQFVLEI